MDTLIEFINYGPDGIATIKEGEHTIEIVRLEENMVIRDDGKEVASLPYQIKINPSEYPVYRDLTSNRHITKTEPGKPVEREKIFSPPNFGFTVLGNSHGFDSSGSTSGFIIWVHKRGIMIDPPPFCSEVLRKENVPPNLIDKIILTHCHGDHDAGTF